MATNAVWLEIDGERGADVLEEALARLDGAGDEIVLDFSFVRRIDPGGLRAMAKLADAADAKGTKVVLQGVNVGIYKALKLMKLAERFTFQT